MARFAQLRCSCAQRFSGTWFDVDIHGQIDLGGIGFLEDFGSLRFVPISCGSERVRRLWRGSSRQDELKTTFLMITSG